MCGIVGVIGSVEAPLISYYALHALQHRGQEASGIVSKKIDENDKMHFSIIKGDGLVSEVFSDYNLWGKILEGNACIGHNRYSTSGEGSRKNIQPFLVNYHMGNLAVAHNGNLTNASTLRQRMSRGGAIFQTTSDTEVILHLIAKSDFTNQKEQIIDALRHIEGAFSLVILTDSMLVGARDPFGFRPLCLGKKNGSFIITSETCALDINYAEYIRDINPGEMVIIPDGAKSLDDIVSINFTERKEKLKQCIFEYIYFTRPDSKIFGHNVDKMRRRLGKVLAQKYPVTDPDGGKVIVISVPDSSNTTALGYENELKKMGITSKFELGLIRSHYIGRTFISPNQQSREIGVRIKFNIVKGVLENRTVVIVDDSIVRGTTSYQLINLVREANPKSIHLRISSPPILYPCFYGMDFPSREELIAHRLNGDIEAIRKYTGVDTLNYLTIPEMLSILSDDNPEDYCTTCFSGNYPTSVDSNFTKDIYEV
ncbi:MAG: amidophosphoribosyltransferase [Ignavibacteriaceae bacterium]